MKQSNTQQINYARWFAGVGRGGKTRTHADREKGETEFLAAAEGKMVKGKRFGGK